MQNPYIPAPVEVVKIVTEVDTKDIKTFRFAFQNKEDEAAFQYLPGQFADFRSSGRENRRSGSPLRRRSPVIWNSPSRRRGW